MAKQKRGFERLVLRELPTVMRGIQHSQEAMPIGGSFTVSVDPATTVDTSTPGNVQVQLVDDGKYQVHAIAVGIGNIEYRRTDGFSLSVSFRISVDGA